MKTGQKLKQLQKRYNLNKHFYPWFAWYELDSYGHAIYSPDEMFTPPLSLFDSIQEAKDYIKMRLNYLVKKEEVVFDTLTANPPTETGT